MNGDFSNEHYRARTRRADALLYLDFDGVLQTEHVYQSRKRGIYIDPTRAPGRTFFEWAHYLEAALLLAPSVKIILSTTWARHPGYSKALKRLPASVQERVIGATYHNRVQGADPHLKTSFIESPRGMQVWADVRRRAPLGWYALDDDAFGWPAWCRANLIQCQGEVGISDEKTRAELEQRLLELEALCKQATPSD